MISKENCNFEKALKLCQNSFSHEELIALLQEEDITVKQFAVLNLVELTDKSEAEILCSNLVGQDGKIREAVAFKLSEFFKDEKFSVFLSSEKNFKIMLEGLMDINGNVCRHVLEIENEKFDKYLAQNIPDRIKLILDDISKLEKDDKQYVISKRNFQLYWALEGVYKVKDLINFEKLKPILYKTAEYEDYTIKEKTAKILSAYDDTEDIKQILLQNSNYYVDRYLKC